jgi:hypothetical protein
MPSRALRLFGVATLWLISARPAESYSVLTHEAIIDSVWDSHIQGMLLARYPRASTEDLRKAHAYAYGGSLAADMGYMPMSSRFFSDLLHYVRSGTLVETLVREAATLDEYAFALGAVAHYVADRTGHPVINRITPLVYPKLGVKYGPVVTYEDHHTAHLKTEFGLDVLQLARGAYAPESYRDFIGFEIDEAGMKRAFESTYGIRLKDVLSSDVAIGTYRFAVGKLIPEMTKIAWETRHDDIEKLAPEIERSKFVYSLSRNAYEQQWGHDYKKPGLLPRTLAFVLKIFPAVGPLAATRFRVVPKEGEQLFVQAFDSTVAEYRKALDDVRRNRLTLPNYNLDTGMPTRAGEYEMANEAYVKLLDKLDDDDFGSLTAPLRTDILTFFSGGAAGALEEESVMHLEKLRQASPAPARAAR